MIYALVKNGVVINTIVADDNFISTISSNYDACVRVDNIDNPPSIDWLYDGQNFTDPTLELPPQE